MLVEMLVFSS